ncbi:hypothetical protein PTSG_06141 [Salpingoeca rosetta]|uniref:Uncharacterized protein n=1 Tax=Salpingoeca rosetta (strain ATCC 50818 / BSB-021) TaxID=946362 RepID=F2UC24_SALR5|nr:uncharacterized protein PTSG_06141 [Salpingoeca rosetta]EGD74131.1 hypothetical protein PTSG_06141 [Salpingoeca rosetta]|eukprot:XP_004993032.1 hypothetical protein PTSG_06141 [Salpingoeca rosetta]
MTSELLATLEANVCELANLCSAESEQALVERLHAQWRADRDKEMLRLQRDNAKLRAQIQAMWQEQQQQQQQQQRSHNEHDGDGTAGDSVQQGHAEEQPRTHQGHQRRGPKQEWQPAATTRGNNGGEVATLRRQVDELKAALAKKDEGLRKLAQRNQELQRLVDASDLLDMAAPF